MGLSKSQRSASLALLTAINNAQDENGNPRADPFHVLPPRADLPDYYTVIQNPVALDIVRDKRNKYPSWQAFLQDLFQIFHNAKTYNRSDSPLYIDAEALEEVVLAELQRLVEENVLTAEEAERPDLGPLPEASNASDEEGDHDNDQEHEQGDGGAIGGGGGGSTTPSTGRRRKGRAPYTETAEETLMSTIIRRLRNVSRGGGKPLAPPFERLPDKADYPDYYKRIQDPMCLTMAKANIRKQVYNTVDDFVADLKRIFYNAQQYNEEGSTIYNAAATLLTALDEIVLFEKRTPEERAQAAAEAAAAKKAAAAALAAEQEAFASEESVPLLPMVRGRRNIAKIPYNNRYYAIGDWILLHNPNDPEVPTVAQIHRCFQHESDRSFGIHVCWFFRPRQTVHRADRRFFEHEVFKTNHYRDHPITDLVGDCHVMYLTKYVRGRPKALQGNEENLFVCEFRYNVEERKFTKIKSWKSCLTEGVREQDANAELIEFPTQRYPERFPSPLLYLLPPGDPQSIKADPDAPMPDVLEQADKNAPPKTGNLILCPPTPTPESVQAMMAGSNPTTASTTALMSDTAGVAVPMPLAMPMTTSPSVPIPQAQSQPQTAYLPSPAAARTVATAAGHATPAGARPLAPMRQGSLKALNTPLRGSALPAGAGGQGTPVTYASPYAGGVSQSTASQQGYMSPYNNTATPAQHPQQQQQQQQPLQMQQQQAPMQPAVQTTQRFSSLGNRVHATALTLTGPEGPQVILPEAVKRRFVRDKQGEVVWFTVPPVEPIAKAVVGQGVLGHSLAYEVWRLQQQQ